MDGALVIDKPAGITSHDVVDRARRRLGVKRIGHAGTLDPPATGALVLGVGRATRLMRFVEIYDKEYTGTIVFGVTTSTLDDTGEVVSRAAADGLDAAAVAAAAASLTGEIDQVPPMVSAVKVGGERLYAKARRGEQVERAPRRVRVEAFEVTAPVAGDQVTSTFRVVCSKGTYVRSLVADLGAAVGTGAHLSGLRRTRVGHLTAEGAPAPDEVTEQMISPMEHLLAGYPRRMVTEPEARALIEGKVLPAAGIEGPYSVVGPAGLVAMAEDSGDRCKSLCVVSA